MSLEVSSKTNELFYKVISREKKRSKEEYQKWTINFLKTLIEKCKEPPTYLNDPSCVLLLFRKYDETQTPLSIAAQRFRLTNSLRLWYYLLKKEMRDEWLDQDPLDVIETHTWSNDLIQQGKKETLQSIGELKHLIQISTSKGEGLFACPECHSKKFVESHTEQRARADEGMTTVNICTRCNNKKWTVRG